VPQSWFLHFYVLGALCSAATLIAFACSCCGAGGAAATVEQVRARGDKASYAAALTSEPNHPLTEPLSEPLNPTPQPQTHNTPQHPQYPHTPNTPKARAVLALALFQFHLIRRATETAFVMRYPADARMHGIAYAFGLSYYAAVPLSLLPTEWLSAMPNLKLLPDSVGGCVASARGAVGQLVLQRYGSTVATLAVAVRFYA